MIPVAELKKIAHARLDDAKALLAAGRFDAATYLCGYAVELALKARICRTLSWSDFPRTPGEFQSYRSFRTHDLEVLLHLSGQEARITQQHFALWYVLVVWTRELRYNPIGTAQSDAAEAMIAAAETLRTVL